MATATATTATAITATTTDCMMRRISNLGTWINHKANDFPIVGHGDKRGKACEAKGSSMHTIALHNISSQYGYGMYGLAHIPEEHSNSRHTAPLKTEETNTHFRQSPVPICCGLHLMSGDISWSPTDMPKQEGQPCPANHYNSNTKDTGQRCERPMQDTQT